MMDKIEYNKKTSKLLGWKPEWFGCNDFDQTLIDSIKKFQKDHYITSDGLVGPSTFRRIYTEQEALAESAMTNNNVIICDVRSVPIEWSKVRLYTDISALRVNNYTDVSSKIRYPKLFMLHWDVCLSSKSCVNVLNKRGLSVHFSIDNDGTIHQLMNTQDIAYHAGSVVNKASIGVEISNAYYTKYNSVYEKRGFGKRDVVSGVKVHKVILEPHLDFYPVQIDALKALIKALNLAYGIPFECPMDGDELCIKEHQEVKNGTFEGVANHYNITKNKIDCAGLDLLGILKELRGY